MTGEALVRKVRFDSGGLKLEGLLSLPARYAGVGAVVCHPHPLYGGDMRNLLVARVAQELSASGVAVLRFNFRGSGDSEGGHDNGAGEADDVTAALTHLYAEVEPTATHLAGYSFGAAMMLKASRADRRAATLTAIAPPVAFMEVDPGAADDTRPKLVVTGGRDSFCDRESFSAWYARVAQPRGVREFPEADHFFGGVEREVAAVVAGFVAAGF